MKKWFFFISIFIIWMIPDSVFAEEVHLYLFYGNTCPVCERERGYLQELVESNQDIRLFEFETYDNIENEVNMQQVKEMYHIRGEGVPFLVVGDIAIYGFGNGTSAKIESAIKKQRDRDYYDRVGVYLGLFEDEEIHDVIEPDEEISDEADESGSSSNQEQKRGTGILVWIGIGTILFGGCLLFIKIFYLEK